MKSIGTVSRRHFVALSGLAASQCAVLNASDKMPDFVEGRVYLDKKEQGKCLPTLPGIAGVAVTNGRDVVATDAQGRFKLPTHPKFRFVTITTPAGHRNTTSYYCPRSASAYTFGLCPIKQAELPHFIHITDTEMHNGNDWTWVDILNEYATHNEDVAFVINTGDICYRNGMIETAKRFKVTTNKIPVYHCLGNHDLVSGPYGEHLFEQLFGPTYYSFNVGNTHFVVTPMLGGDARPDINREDVKAWLIQDLAQMKPGQKLIAFNHDLLTSGKTFNYGDLNLNDHNLVAWLYGHWHINLVRKQGDVMSITPSPVDKGGIDNAPSNFYDIEVTKDGTIGDIDVRYTYTRHHVAAMPLPEVGANARSRVIHAYDAVANVTGFTVSGSKIPFEKINDWSYRLLPTATLRGDVTVTFNDDKQVTVPLTPPASAIKPQWMQSMKGKAFRASPIIVGNTVYVATTDDGNRRDCSVAAFARDTGKKLWETPMTNSINGSIVASNGRIFAINAEDILTVLEATTGKVVSIIPMSGSKLPANVTGLTEEDGIIYAGFQRSLGAIDAKTLKKIWHGANYGGEGTVARHVIHGDILLSSSQWSGLYGHDKKTGKRLWSVGSNGIRFRGSAPLALDDKTIFVPSESSLNVVEVATGKVIKAVNTKNNFLVASDPIKVGDLVILGTVNNGVVAYNTTDWSEVWTLPVGQSLFYTGAYSKAPSRTVECPMTLTADGKRIIFGASDGIIRLAEVATGKVLDTYNLGAPIFSKIAQCGEGYIVSDFAGSVTAFKLA